MKRFLFLSMIVLASISLAIFLSSCELFVPEPENGTIRIISIGIDYSNYGGSNKPSTLKGTVNDAKAISQAYLALAQAAVNLSEFSPESNIIEMLQEKGKVYTATDPSYPSKTNILDQLEIFKECDKNDITVIYYSGHGDTDGSLLPAYSATESNARISPEEMLEALVDIPGKKVLILDSCFSGNHIPHDETTIDLQTSENAWHDAFASLWEKETTISSDSLFVISAASTDKQSFEPGDEGHGFFTESILKGLGLVNEDTEDGETTYAFTTPPACNGNTLTIDGLFSYAVSEMPTEYVKLQSPQLIRGLYDLVLFEF